MENKMNKVMTDVAAMICLLASIVTGMNLHAHIHHAQSCHQELLYSIHVISGFVTFIAVSMHSYQHKYWFVNYRRIPTKKKRITTVLAVTGILVAITGLSLLSCHHSVKTSIWHYVAGIAFSLMAVAHVMKRWDIFIRLLSSRS